MIYALDTNIISFMLKEDKGIINSYLQANSEGLSKPYPSNKTYTDTPNTSAITFNS